MTKSILKLSVITGLVLGLAGLATPLSAQTTNAKPSTAHKPDAAAPHKPATDKKPSAHPFNGKLAAVDKTAKTIMLGKSTYQVTSETKITKAGKPAILDDGVIGEPVSGYAKPGDDGKMVATTVHFGPKAEEKKKKDAK